MQVVSVAIQKGGTGKTATATSLAQAMAYKNKKVLAIDLDSQGNLTYALKADANAPGIYELLHGANIKDTIQNVGPNLDVIPASWNLSQEQTDRATNSAMRLKHAIEPIKENYDLIIIDTPPAINEALFNAFNASTGVIIPLEADANSLQGLYQINEVIRAFKHLEIKGIVITKWDSRSVLSRQMQEQIIVTANKYKIPYLGSIRNGIAIREATALQTSLYEYAKNSKPAQDYMELLERIL